METEYIDTLEMLVNRIIDLLAQADQQELIIIDRFVSTFLKRG